MIYFIIITCLLAICLFLLGKKLYKPAELWAVSLFEFDNIENFKPSRKNLIKTFSPKCNIRTKYHYCTGFADPFLLVKNDYLYLFFEEELLYKPAKIRTKRTKDLKHWEDLGIVLEQDFHLSFPNVFSPSFLEKAGEAFYMMPESYQDRAINLYKSTTFPHKWEKKKLLDGKFVDSVLVEKNGKWFLFTTEWNTPNLRLFFADSFEAENWTEHPLSPISTDITNSRNGGTILNFDGNLYRFAQDCSHFYGENVGLFRIDELSETDYKEQFVRNLIDKNNKFSRLGGHHFNCVEFKGKKIAVMDGIINDNLINNLTRKIFNYLL
jgi:hypothetical protein